MEEAIELINKRKDKLGIKLTKRSESGSAKKITKSKKKTRKRNNKQNKITSEVTSGFKTTKKPTPSWIKYIDEPLRASEDSKKDSKKNLRRS